MKKYIIAFLIPLLSLNIGYAGGYTSLNLKKGDMEILLFPPDSINGYYRASRFDWGSILGQIKYKGKTFLQEWKGYSGRPPKGDHDPLVPNTGTGLSEEFNMPQGYDEAKPGDSFVKIGVGVLLKEDNDKYSFAKPYRILDKGIWNVKKKKGSILLTHKLESEIGYAYILKREYLIKDNKLIVRHKLMNKGRKKIVTEAYSHNFMQQEFLNVGPDYTLTFLKSDADISKHKWTTVKRITLNGNVMNVNTEINDFIPCFGDLDVLSGYGDFRLSNAKAGTSVEMSLNRKVSSFSVWFWQRAFCAEPRVMIELEPGKEFTWEYVYTFEVDL